MTVTITAVVQSGLRVAVTVTDTAPTGRYTLYADDLIGPRRPVRGAVNVPAGSTVYDDVEAPLARPVWYVAVLSSGVERITATPITVTSPTSTVTGRPLPVLSDPTSGEYVAVSVLEWPEVSYPNRSTMIDIEGARQRVRLFDQEGSPGFPTMVLGTRTEAELRALRRLCSDGSTLQLRGGRDGIEDCYLGHTADRVEQRVSMKADDWRRKHAWKSVETLPQPDPTLRATGGSTLGDLAAAVPTNLGAIAALWPTLGAIAAADL